jgi:hypothetical protein
VTQTNYVLSVVDERCRRLCEKLIGDGDDIKTKFAEVARTSGIVTAIVGCEELLVAAIMRDYALSIKLDTESKLCALSWSDALDHAKRRLELSLIRNQFDRAVNADLQLIQLAQRRATAKFTQLAERVLGGATP